MPRFKVPRSTRTMYGTVTPAVVVVVARSAGAVPEVYGLKQLLVGAGVGGLGSGSAVEQPAVVGAGVAQIQGWVCEPSNTGPPIGWLVIVSRACGPPCPSPLASAANSLSPSTRSVTTPRRVRAAALPLNAAVTSRPLSRKLTWFSGTFFGTRTSSSASPPLTRSARFDSDTISKLDGPSPAWAVARSTAPSARNDDLMQVTVSSSLRRLPPSPGLWNVTLRAAYYASACFTRSGAKGSARRRLPVACAMALAIAAAAGPCEPSPTPRKRSSGRSSSTTSTCGTSPKWIMG